MRTNLIELATEQDICPYVTKAGGHILLSTSTGMGSIQDQMKFFFFYRLPGSKARFGFGAKPKQGNPQLRCDLIRLNILFVQWVQWRWRKQMWKKTEQESRASQNLFLYREWLFFWRGRCRIFCSSSRNGSCKKGTICSHWFSFLG